MEIQRMELTFESVGEKEICQWKAEVDGATYGARIEIWVPYGMDGKKNAMKLMLENMFESLEED